MKDGTFGKDRDIPPQKKDSTNIDDDIKLSEDSDNSSSNQDDNEEKIQNKEQNNKKQELNSSNENKGENSVESNDEKETNNKKEENKKEIKETQDTKETQETQEKKDKQIEEMLLNSIKNRENATSQKIKMAEEINFGAMPDKLITTDEFGFIIDKKSESTDLKNKEKDELLKINARIEKWNYMIENYDEFRKKKADKLKSRTRKGIPDSLRSYVWQLFANKDKYYKKDLFQKLDSEKVNEDLETVIIKDLDRTYPDCQLFKDKYGNGQRKLYKVLSNYSKYNKSTGYVQGMGFIAAVFLIYMDEESSFFMLHSLMKEYKLEGFFLPNFPELKKTFYILLNLEKKFIPRIYELFKKEGMMPSMYASEWFICLFSRNLEFQALVRVYDVFLLEGYKVIYRFALAFLKSKEDEFLKATDGLPSIMQTVNKCLENVDIENVFKTAFGFSLSRKDLDKLGKEYDKVKNNQNNEFIKQL